MAARVSGSEEERQGTTPVPVQMTSLVPVRVVSVHGDFFDTELHQDAPLRVLQRAVEDCFKVRTELQLLTHNRRQINPNVSLRRNGCLLLKGDPYVKIVLDVKKGTKLNVVCQIPHREPIPLVCEGVDTVWDVKKKLCTAVAQTDWTPQRIRLLWRYWELNNKATLDYYHLPTNAKLTVMKRRGFSAKQQQPHAEQEQHHTTGSSSLLGAPGDPKGDALKEFVHNCAGIPPQVNGNNNNSSGNQNHNHTAAGVASSNSEWPLPSKQFGRAVIPLNPGIEYDTGVSFAQRCGDASALRVQGMELAQASHAESLMDLARLRQEVASLEHRIASYGAQSVGYELLQESYRATLGRVAELENTVGQFQKLLRRTLMLL